MPNFASMTKADIAAWGASWGVEIPTTISKDDMIVAAEAAAKDLPPAIADEQGAETQPPAVDAPPPVVEEAPQPAAPAPAKPSDGSITVTVTGSPYSDGVPLLVNGRELMIPLGVPTRIPLMFVGALRSAGSVTFTEE